MTEEFKGCIERNQTKEILGKNGWKVRSDIVITQMKKSELLEYIRMLEHNWACALMRHENTIRYIEGTINAKSAEDIKFQGVTMFEKEAEEYTENQKILSGERFVRKAYKDGAEFGYNKAFVEADKNLKAVVADFNKANEWHYVKDELPELYKDVLVVFPRGDCDVKRLTNHNEWVGRGSWCSLTDINAWKEIVLPKEIKENE